MFKDNGQAKRLKKMFPKLKKYINIVHQIPKNVTKVKEKGPNKYYPETVARISNATKDVYLHGYLGKPKEFLLHF